MNQNTLPGNPHVESERDRNTHTNEGLIEATIALAYEQRTANLIALYGAEDLANKMDTPAWEHVSNQIKERLGLA